MSDRDRSLWPVYPRRPTSPAALESDAGNQPATGTAATSCAAVPASLAPSFKERRIDVRGQDVHKAVALRDAVALLLKNGDVIVLDAEAMRAAMLAWQ